MGGGGSALGGATVGGYGDGGAGILSLDSAVQYFISWVDVFTGTSVQAHNITGMHACICCTHVHVHMCGNAFGHCDRCWRLVHNRRLIG